VARSAGLPLTARGRVRAVAAAWHLDGMKLQLGRSAATIDAHRADDGARPVTVAVVRGPLVDLPELLALGTGSGKRAGDVPLFASGFALP
jgi:hypothetical protein